MEYTTSVNCRECNGNGRREVTIDIGRVIDIVDEAGPQNKINCIKQVRTETLLGLKQSKDLVEATMSYMNQVSHLLPARE